MNKKQIIRMAREADLIRADSTTSPYRSGIDLYYQLREFARLVAAAERDACAATCYRHAALIVDPIDREGIYQCAAAIRARGQA